MYIAEDRSFEDWAGQQPSEEAQLSPEAVQPVEADFTRAQQPAFEDWVQQKELTYEEQQAELRRQQGPDDAVTSPTQATPIETDLDAIPQEAYVPGMGAELAAPREPEVTTEVITGDVQSNTDVEEHQETQDDGSTVRYTVTTTRHIRPKIEKTFLDGTEQDERITEELVGTDVEENVLKLPPGHSEPFGENIQTSTSVQEFEESLPDGTWLRKKIVTTTVTAVSPSAPPGDLVERAGEIVSEAFDEAVTEAVSTAPGEPLKPPVQEDVEEYDEKLPDGRVVRRKIIRTRTETTTIVRVVTTTSDGEVIEDEVIEDVSDAGQALPPMATEAAPETYLEPSPLAQDQIPQDQTQFVADVATKFREQPQDAGEKPISSEQIPESGQEPSPEVSRGMEQAPGKKEFRPELDEGTQLLPDVADQEIMSSAPPESLLEAPTEPEQKQAEAELQPAEPVKEQFEGAPITTTIPAEQLYGEQAAPSEPTPTEEPVSAVEQTPAEMELKLSAEAEPELLPEGAAPLEAGIPATQDLAKRAPVEELRSPVEQAPAEAEIKPSGDVEPEVLPAAMPLEEGIISAAQELQKPSAVELHVPPSAVDFSPEKEEAAPQDFGFPPVGPIAVEPDQVEEVEETMPDGTVVKRRIIHGKARKVVTRKIRRVGPDGEVIEDVITEEVPSDSEVLSEHSSRRSSMSDVPISLSATEPGSPDEYDPERSALKVYTDTIEGEPEIETDVQEFEETLPDGTVVKRKVIKTKQKQMITKRVVMEGPEDDLPTTEEQAQVMLMQADQPELSRYTDRIEGEPEQSTNVQEYEETLDDGTVVKRKVVTTTEQQMTTDRMYLEGAPEDVLPVDEGEIDAEIQPGRTSYPADDEDEVDEEAVVTEDREHTQAAPTHFPDEVEEAYIQPEPQEPRSGRPSVCVAQQGK